MNMQQDPQEKAIAIAQAFSRGHDAGWESAAAHHKARAEPARQVYAAVPQFRVQGCSDWRDGHPGYSDGMDAYEARTLYTSPPQRKPLTGEEMNQIEARWDASMHGSKIAFVVRETEAAHDIKEKNT